MKFKIIALSFALLTTAVSAAETVKVSILAGQSNMEGKVQNILLEHQAGDPKTADLFKHLRKDGQWVKREDVFVKFLGKHGPLTIGYGSRDRSGVELELGTVLGNHFDEPVLLIKTAWGGHSLHRDFRPPSAELSEDRLKAELEQAVAKAERKNQPIPTMEDFKQGYGKSYREMLKEVEDTLGNYETLFPALKGKKPEIAGFVWFQGWNDMKAGATEYASNLKHLIIDVRKDLGAPDMPVVIGVMGQNGSTPAKGGMLTVQEAQLAMEKVAGFKGNVRAVRTDVLVDKAAEELFPNWKQNFEEWKKVGSDRPYHYFGSAIWHVRMGRHFGNAMIELLQ